MPVVKEVLKIVSKAFDINTFRILRALTGILKGPVALSIFSLEISFSISSCVTGEIKKLLSEQSVRYCKGDV